MNTKKKKYILYILIIIFFVVYFLYSIFLKNDVKHYEFDYSWTNNNLCIAHALGAINEDEYTNSLEAFKYNYERGYRVFEVDFDITVDNYVICCHDEYTWRLVTQSEDDYNYDNFLNTKIYNKYTSLSLIDLFNLMKEYKDIYIITDTKYTDIKSINKQFNTIVDTANEVDESILDRIIPQIYNDKMLKEVMNIYPFKSVIYTLYNEPNFTKESVLSLCNKSGIKFITCNEYKVLDDSNLDYWKGNGMIVATHTINDLNDAKNFINEGVDMIYTDYIIDSELKGDK